MISTKNAVDPDWREALGRAVEAGHAGAEGLQIFVEQREDATVTLDDGGAEPTLKRRRTLGMSVGTRWGGGRTIFRADPAPEDVEPLVRCAVRGGAEPGSRPSPRAEREGPALPLSAARGLVADLVRATGRLQPRATVTARWVGLEQRVHVARPGREVVEDRRRGSRVRVEVCLPQRGMRALAVAESVLPDDPGRIEPRIEWLAERVAGRLEARIGARRLESGEYPVVFAPGLGGVLMHEIVGHALEADAVLEDASWIAADRTRPSVGPGDLMVVDDPRRGRVAWRYDDEGQPSRATPLIRTGKVVGRLHDLRSSRACGEAATGHGRRSSYREPVRPRMGCTFVAPGNHHPREVLEGVAEGIYVRRMEAASTDTTTGRAVFKVTDADRVHRGRIDVALRSHLLIVEGRRALRSIDRLGSDLEFDTCIGSCLHHGQPLSISVGGPTFRLGMASVRF